MIRDRATLQASQLDITDRFESLSLDRVGHSGSHTRHLIEIEI